MNLPVPRLIAVAVVATAAAFAASADASRPATPGELRLMARQLETLAHPTHVPASCLDRRRRVAVSTVNRSFALYDGPVLGTPRCVGWAVKHVLYREGPLFGRRWIVVYSGAVPPLCTDDVIPPRVTFDLFHARCMTSD